VEEKISLGGNTGNLGHLPLKLFGGFFTRAGKAAAAAINYLYPPRKINCSLTHQTVLACGAEWHRDCKGGWYLMEAKGAKVETAILEFIEYLGLPRLPMRGESEKELFFIKRLATFVELGLSLPVECFRYPAQAEDDHRYSTRPRKVEKQGGGAEHRHTQKGGQDAGGPGGPVQGVDNYGPQGVDR